jgi:hypothetical protein
MAPPSTAKAMAVTFFNVAFFKPPIVSCRLLITSGDTAQIRFSSGERSANESRADIPDADLPFSLRGVRW